MWKSLGAMTGFARHCFCSCLYDLPGTMCKPAEQGFVAKTFLQQICTIVLLVAICESKRPLDSSEGMCDIDLIQMNCRLEGRIISWSLAAACLDTYHSVQLCWRWHALWASVVSEVSLHTAVSVTRWRQARPPHPSFVLPHMGFTYVLSMAAGSVPPGSVAGQTGKAWPVWVLLLKRSISRAVC